jgi:hypothetical protein
MNLPMTVTIQRSNGRWFAQMHEYDIAAQAQTLHGVLAELGRVCAVQEAIDQEQGREVFSDVPATPRETIDRVRQLRQ